MSVPKIHESELKVLNLLWESAPRSASEIAALLAESTGWSKNTSYTVLTKLTKKGLVRREDPGFLCSPAVDKDMVRRSETRSLAQRLYDGSVKLMFARMIEDRALSEAELRELRALLDERSRDDV